MNPHLPSLRQLRYLVVLSEELHFGRAAERCHVTQSTLSAGIQELETVLGVTVVERTKRRVSVTPLGLDLVERARRVLADVTEMTVLAKSSDTPLTGLLRLGAIPTIGPYVLPRVLPALRGSYPDLQLYLREEKTSDLIAALDGGGLDAALVALPAETGEAETTILADDPFWFACAPDHPLARGKKPLAMEALVDEKLLLLEEGHCLSDQVLLACAGPTRGRMRPGNEFQATSLYTLVELVAGGLGATLLPEIALDTDQVEGAGIAVRPLKGSGGPQGPRRRIALAWRRNSARHAEFRLLAQFLRNRLAKKGKS